MDHPLLHPVEKEKRQRVVAHLRCAYNIRKNSNIVFVCGGNDEEHLRRKFIKFCEEEKKEIQIFLPEYAINTVLGSDVDEQFDLSDFEELVADLSHSIVIFPEAPGSWAETGYFSAIEKVSKSCILALNSEHQGDSFISLGPALKIERSTIFRPNIFLDYKNPRFNVLVDKIKSRNFSDAMRRFVIDDFSRLTAYEICGLICGIVDLLSTATCDDVFSFMKIISGNRFKKGKVRQYLSVLVGAGFLLKFGDYDHLRLNRKKPRIIHTIEGYVIQENLLKLELLNLYQSEYAEFAHLVENL